ncbi:hypothetical protein [Pseudaminobacter sp. NGMCC 1.201702]|uniref:hypothetical protein n=1 Tax=Pseudaminobacter sp. NGMCC 1.201702 TaxID=3391825 RepID=UPI0039F127A0
MPRFTIETTYRMPYYRHAVYNAATSEEACRLAIEDDDWSCELPDHECAGPTYVTGIWKGGGAAYEGKNIPVPSQFDETIQRKADHFTELLDQLAFVARPTGASVVDFERWLPRAMAAVEKARGTPGSRAGPAVHLGPQRLWKTSFPTLPTRPCLFITAAGPSTRCSCRMLLSDLRHGDGRRLFDLLPFAVLQ